MIPRKLSLLEERLHGEFGSTGKIPRVERTGPIPLSFAQRRLWFLDQLMPGSPFYNLFYSARLALPINAGVLDRSLQEIARRHEVLRTSFAVEAGEPVQVVASSMRLPFEILDLRSLP